MKRVLTLMFLPLLFPSQSYGQETDETITIPCQGEFHAVVRDENDQQRKVDVQKFAMDVSFRHGDVSMQEKTVEGRQMRAAAGCIVLGMAKKSVPGVMVMIDSQKDAQLISNTAFLPKGDAQLLMTQGQIAPRGEAEKSRYHSWSMTCKWEPREAGECDFPAQGEFLESSQF